MDEVQAQQQQQVDIRDLILLVGEKETQNFFLRKRIDELTAQLKQSQPKAEEPPK